MKINVYSLILGLFLLGFSYIIPEITWIVCIFIIIYYYLTNVQRIHLVVGVKQISYLILIPIIGLIYSIGHIQINIIRDLWIFSLPIIPFLLGRIASVKIKSEAVVQIVLCVSILLSLKFLINYIINYSKISISDQFAYRQEMGGVDILVAIGILLSIDMFFHRDEIGHNDSILAVTACVCGAIAVSLSLSRTSYISIGIGLFIIIIPSVVLVSKRIYWSSLGGSIIIIMMLLSIIGTENSGHENLVGRMSNSLSEVTETNFQNAEDLSGKYRSYETVMAMQTYLAGNLSQYIVGGGLGTLVDLEIELELGNPKLDLPPMRYIPVLHNGYMYLIVKTGLLGFVLFMMQFYRFWEILRVKTDKYHDMALIRAGKIIIIISLVSMFVVSGPYNKGGWFSVMLLLGIVIEIGNISKFKPNILKHQW